MSILNWIPVTEQLPEHLEDVLVCINGYIEVAYYDVVSRVWWDHHSYKVYPSYWMPLPEPPWGDENEV